MEDIRQYLLSVILCTIICAITIHISGKTGMVPSVIKLLTGLFILYTVLSPWSKMRLTDLSSYFSDLKVDASVAVEEGKEASAQYAASIIKSELEAYILDKASSLGLDICVDVIMDESQPQLPHSVKIGGSVSPYAKQRLAQIISDELGIPKENLLWT